MDQDPLKNYLSWADLVMMTLGFSFPTAVLGWPPFFGLIFAAIMFGFLHIDDNVKDPKNKNARYVAFLISLIIGLLGSYIAAGSLIYAGKIGTYSEEALIGSIGFGVLVFGICLSFFINYGTVLGWWTPTGGLVTLLISIIPAMAIGKNAGINMLVSFIVSSFVYALLVGDNKNKKEPWMIWQAAYIGLMAGSAAALIIPNSNSYLSIFTDVLQAISPSADTGFIKNKIYGNKGTALSGAMIVIWFVYFIIWILSFIPGKLPRGWDTLFKSK